MPGSKLHEDVPQEQIRVWHGGVDGPGIMWGCLRTLVTVKVMVVMDHLELESMLFLHLFLLLLVFY